MSALRCGNLAKKFVSAKWLCEPRHECWDRGHHQHKPKYKQEHVKPDMTYAAELAQLQSRDFEAAL
eukprot:8526403-Karenia_brevis.AAC.1